MALAEAETHCEKKKVEHTSKTSDKKDKPLTKIIVRRLPPGITQESFLNQVSPVPEYNYIYTVKADLSLGENSFSRVYINFCNSEDIYDFKEKFDNYVFVDTKGHEYPAVVEYAPFQKVPKKRTGKHRQDPKCATIESELAYVEFLESLNSQPSQEEKPEYSYQPNTETKNENSTPLLDYVKQRRVDRQRIREEKREERKKKDLERKKYNEEKKKYYEEKSPGKYSKPTASTSKTEADTKDKAATENKSESETTKPTEKTNEKDTVASLTYRNKKYDEHKTSAYPKGKPKYPPRENDYYERSYKNKYEKYEKYDKFNKEKEYKKKTYDEKKEPVAKAAPKKIKKYSERREEMKAQAQASIKQTEDQEVPEKEKEKEATPCASKKSEEHSKASSVKASTESVDNNSDERQDDYSSDSKCKGKENDPRSQRRIRNKDRPTMAIYQPGMLRKKQGDEPEGKNVNE